MKSPADVAVVIVAYNCRDLILDCIQSLSIQRHALEVIVVDNASIDSTIEAVQAAHPWVRTIRSEENRGFAWASNVGISSTDTPFVLLLNPDTIVPPGTIDRCVDVLRDQTHIGMLGCRLVQLNGQLDWACKRGEPTPWASLCYFTGLSKVFPGSRLCAGYVAGHLPDDRPGPVDHINGAFMLVRREAVADVGLLDESFWMYMEDLDWCRRFRERGWTVYYHPQETITHIKGGASGKRRSRAVNRAFHDSMWIYYRKHEYERRHRLTSATVWCAVQCRSRLVQWQNSRFDRRQASAT